MRRSRRRSAKKLTEIGRDKSVDLDKRSSNLLESNPEKKSFNGAKSALKEPRLPSSVILPKNVGAANDILDDASLLAEIRKRISNQNARTIRVSPVPKSCPPLLLQNFCPTSVAVRIPSGRSHRYAFVEFKTSAEAVAAAKELSGKLVNGKMIRAVVCSERPNRTEANWEHPAERGLDAFDLTTLYVSCLPRLTERTTLAQIFRTADKIKYESLPDGTFKGFCFLKYKTRKLAQKAFMERHGTLLKGIPIFVNFLIKPREKLEAKETARKEEASYGKLKRKASEDDNVMVRSKKKRRCEDSNPADGDLTQQTGKTSIEKRTERTLNGAVPFREANKDPNFSIKYSEDSGTTKAKLQPYQLLKKKSGKKLKKPKKNK